MTTQVKLALAGLALLAAFGIGWMANGWRLGRDIENLRGKVALVEGANNRCAIAVGDVNKTLNGMRADQEKRAADAKAAVLKAQADAKDHYDAALAALQRPAPDPGKECDTVAREARGYFNRRHGK
jgi:hypothetical protein